MSYSKAHLWKRLAHEVSRTRAADVLVDCHSAYSFFSPTTLKQIAGSKVLCFKHKPQGALHPSMKQASQFELLTNGRAVMKGEHHVGIK